MDNHSNQWDIIRSAITSKRIPQAMLFVGPQHCDLAAFTTRVMQLLFCKKGQQGPCYSCVDCDLLARQEYPDVEWIKPDKSGGAIKVDQIRELHQTAYLTPQKSDHRVIVIEAADRMNTASANALLKILEEPAQHTIFILIAQQLSTVLPTILSRCQVIHFTSSDDALGTNLLYLGEQYAKESDRAEIISQSDVILDDLIAVIEGREHPCVLAPRFTKFEAANLFWFLYLVHSQILSMHHTKTPVTGPASKQLNRLLSLLNPILIYTQIDKINAVLKKLSHNMNINYTLVVEDVLFSLAPSNK